MPFTQDTDETTRLYPPTEMPGIAEGDWIDISVTYTAAMRRRARLRAIRGRFDDEDLDYFEYKQSILEAIIKAWSDPSPVSPDAIANLHPFVQDWVSNQFYELANGRTEDEKKGSSSDSSPTSDPAEETSPASSLT